MSNNLEFMKEHNCKHLKNCKFASVVKYQYSDDKKGCDNSLYACENDNFISLWEIKWNFNDIENSIETIEVIGNIFDNPELLEGGE